MDCHTRLGFISGDFYEGHVEINVSYFFSRISYSFSGNKEKASLSEHLSYQQNIHAF